MSEEIETRLVKLEIKTDTHAAELSGLRLAFKELRQTMCKIELNLTQIKWMVVGGLAVVVFQGFGLEKVAKILMGAV